MKVVANKIMSSDSYKIHPYMRRKTHWFFKKRKVWERPNRGIFSRVMDKKGAFRRKNLRITKLWPVSLHKHMPI